LTALDQSASWMRMRGSVAGRLGFFGGRAPISLKPNSTRNEAQ
jgi:hypothetical protein